MPPPKSYTLTFTGDVMLGRLVDQLFPTHNSNPSTQSTLSTFLNAHPALKSYSHRSPWGTTLPLFHTSDLNLINLETAVTTSNTPWPNKAFNYRMHPDNLKALKEARIDYASLANNHTFDFSEPGLEETVREVRASGVRLAGVGKECDGAAVLTLPRDLSSHSFSGGLGAGSESKIEAGSEYKVHVYSASDHPRMWSSFPHFNFIDYTLATRVRLKELLTKGVQPALKIFSVHWGPNYTWRPDGEIRSLAHFLVDECGVDIVHGHSAHHVQGVEVYRGALILYGCGDFVDDYALNGEFRNDLGAVWRVVVADVGGRLGVQRLEVFPTRCERFVVELLGVGESDHAWVRERIAGLSREFGTEVRGSLGREGQFIVDLS
ncbi:hypothetical protein BDV23DRAFT_182075 [Aspergillus alliaceus]|uniref:Capsule synthesis protein CapA domain-containing protein n=1 Tax=Petromyces alliaceus TaxID=209559 RepID=A0A5N7CCW8_PETAA|nr:hypothetical protein BDV23DRAFT_182075 [Aspergillus alliaceus]